MQRVSQPSAAFGGEGGHRRQTLSKLTTTLPDIITPATMIPPQIAPPVAGSPTSNKKNMFGTATTAASANDLSTIEVFSIFRGHQPLDCSVPAERPGRMMVMKIFAKKVQHKKDILFVNMLFDGENVKLLGAPSPDASTPAAAAGGDQQPEEEKKKLLLEIKGSCIDLVRLSKRDATFFYFTTRNAVWDSPPNSPLLNYSPESEGSSISGFDVFAFHATSPRAAERCYRLLQQFAEANAASELIKYAGKVPGTAGSGFFHLAGSLLSTPSMVAHVADAATSTTTNHNNNNITFLSNCDGRKASKKSMLGGDHHVSFAPSLETKRGNCPGSEDSSPAPQSQPPSADLMLLCDFSSAADDQQQHSDTSMSDLFDDLAMPHAPRANVLGGGGGSKADLLGDLFKSSSSSTLPTSPTPVAHQIPHLPPPPQALPRPMMQPQLQQQYQQPPPFMPTTNPFAASMYSNLAATNPFASAPLQPQPAAISSQFQSFGGAPQLSRNSMTTSSAFSTDFNDFLQQTVKGHFKA